MKETYEPLEIEIIKLSANPVETSNPQTSDWGEGTDFDEF